MNAVAAARASAVDAEPVASFGILSSNKTSITVPE
jgi:hypothetical protein